MVVSAPGFASTEDQDELRRTVRAFLERRSAESDVRRVIETDPGYDVDVWRQMAELGLQGLAVPEEFGGGGFGYQELSVVVEEAGRALLPGPFFGSVVMAGSVLLCSDDDDAKSRYLPSIASGEAVAALALTEESGRWDVDDIKTTARRTESGWTINGTKTFVVDGHIADLVLVVALTDKGISLFAVDGTDGLSRRTLSTLDPTRRQARVEFSDTPAELIGVEGQATPALSHALDIAAAGLAVEQVGGAQRCLELAVEYAKTRKQFGKPIGSFQAIRHKCADLMLEIECARGVAQYAVQAAATGADELPAAASLAKAYCSETYARAAAANIQIHGGIGFTWEHPAHMYFKRAKSSGLLLGDAAYHRRLLADRVGL
ncbi:acyl-CoA dehydrogenase [Mycolicibacterium moriokaense]|jgi:alkylation response protein AidB-like acyl-CoA dehydrogenase|uniref:Acyl-CoA dehydrogenase n=1 Tax=Mycolicibacterium moriokaense TaxID=39691 RepID=A0AAD1M651_9MYCO|nr:acyl-CoA dehydrogenase family protein [Mycolicibacterium moriokaense]MCV7043044.1 acyl-CoA/acyl-ACP dehydrogenase [Mycolicibacterium moriokaense]ORB18008.1 acyl-CoA dehydrogenase [Mycolicibacterium moriokaense]BBX00949.1 acyl-CoA dehydrogenase [Mycolicibacterium moriokaense]